MSIRAETASKVKVLIQSAFLMAWLTNLSNLGTTQTDSMFCVYALCAIVGVFSFIDNYYHGIQYPVRIRFWSILAAILFSIVTIVANYERFSPLFDPLNLFDLMCSFIGGTMLGYSVLICFLNRLPVKTASADDIAGRTRGQAVFWASFLLVALVELVHLFFVEYPGNLTNDSFTQLGQIISGQYTNHHPYWYTVIIGFFYKLGCSFFHDPNAAVALYGVWQILFMSACFAYTICTLYQAGVPKTVCILVLLLFAFMPYHLAFSICMNKDVIFSGAILAFVVSLYRIVKGLGNRPVLNYLILTLSGIGFCIWRSNGIIAFLACLLFFSWFLWKEHRRVLACMLCVFTVGWFLTNPVLSALGVSQPDKVESFSIPVQQIARVIADDCPLTDEEYALLDKVIDVEAVPDIYVDWLSDPIKDAIREKDNAYFESHIQEYLKLWVQLGLKYPVEYGKAWIDQTKGYWNGGYDYYTYSLGVSSNDLGITEGANDNLIAKISHGIFKICRSAVFMAPFESIGLNVWLLFILFFVNWIKGNREMLLALPGLAVILTLLVATPVFAQFRYAYPVFITCPFVLCVSMYRIPDKV